MGEKVVSFKFLPCMHICLQSLFRRFFLVCRAAKLLLLTVVTFIQILYEYSTSCKYWIVLSTLQAP
jgi:hypothetical protein